MTIQEKFDSVKGWTTQFEIDGVKYGGNVPVLADDPRLHWHIKTIGGLKGKTVLELGPLEGAHTKTMLEAGARLIVSVEGNVDCYNRCLIVKDIFGLEPVSFVNMDFNDYVLRRDMQFDVVSAAGVLYHQENPIDLIRDISKITEVVLVWSQVASMEYPSAVEGIISSYRGKWQAYNNARDADTYCGGMFDRSFWMYPEEMIRCFNDAGFVEIIRGDSPSNINGDSLLFVASKNKLSSS